MTYSGEPDEFVLTAEDPAVEPPLPHGPYRSSTFRSPAQPFVALPGDDPALSSGPIGWGSLSASSVDDLTARHREAPIGQRIIVTGRVCDDRHVPVKSALVEIWQANAAGRYAHGEDQWDAPLDPNFTGNGLAVTDDEGCYRFVTIRPGAYPWGNHHNAWRPAHIHLSVMGPVIGARLVTQLYFPDDPLVALDPIAGAIPEPYRQRMVARLDMDASEPNRALAYRFDLVLRGAQATPFADHG